MSDEIRSIPVDKKQFIGVGKFIFGTFNTGWSIPHLHFLVDKASSEWFEATNLEFGLVSGGPTAEEATQRLAALVHFHITGVMTEGAGYQEFIKAVESHAMDDYWTAYRIIDFSLGEKGKDLSHELEKRITRSIQAMIDDQVKEIIKQKAKQKADEIIRAYAEATSFKLVAVEYTEWEAA